METRKHHPRCPWCKEGISLKPPIHTTPHPKMPEQFPVVGFRVCSPMCDKRPDGVVVHTRTLLEQKKIA